MQFYESDLLFQFGPSWLARKYDDHRFYSRLSGVGLKAVDFITVSPDNQLVFWEIKNFTRRKPELTHDPLQKLIEEKLTFIGDMSQKVEDTFRAIGAIHQYYRRKWNFPLRQWSMSYMKGARSDWYFWLKAHQLGAIPENCRFILLLETDEPDRLPNIHLEMDRALSHLVHRVDVWNLDGVSGLEDVTVRKAKP